MMGSSVGPFFYTATCIEFVTAKVVKVTSVLKETSYLLHLIGIVVSPIKRGSVFIRVDKTLKGFEGRMSFAFNVHVSD